jgi:hypothetical protein
MRSLITAVSLAVAFFIAQPAKAQYSGNDDTIKVQEPTVEKPRKSANTSTKKTPISSDNKSNDNGSQTSVNRNLTSIESSGKHHFQRTQRKPRTLFWVDGQ